MPVRAFVNRYCFEDRFSRAHISAQENHVQLQSHASSLPATKDRAARKPRLDWFSISAALSNSNLAPSLCKWYAAFRSLHAHMQLRFSKAPGRVDLGASVLFQGGRYVANKRTTARAVGIRKFLASHPWADTLDLRTFLSGFESGEEYCIAILRSEPDSQELRSVREKISCNQFSQFPDAGRDASGIQPLPNFSELSLLHREHTKEQVIPK
jgi:hypothetical protein